jgi:hypothetical protein
MRAPSSKILFRIALAATCVASAAAGIALDARSAHADSYTIAPLSAFTANASDASCFLKRYDGLFAQGCGTGSVYAYFPLHRDQDTNPSLVGAYVRFSQNSKGLYCGLDYETVSGSYGSTGSYSQAAGSFSGTMGFGYGGTLPERAAPYLWCRMYGGDHRIWSIRMAEND